MIGKVKVTTPNPPCAICGGMDGYHYRGCELTLDECSCSFSGPDPECPLHGKERGEEHA